jgi:hypothetical protein
VPLRRRRPKTLEKYQSTAEERLRDLRRYLSYPDTGWINPVCSGYYRTLDMLKPFKVGKDDDEAREG